MMRITLSATCLLAILHSCSTGRADDLIGGNGNGSANPGALVRINDVTGAGVIIGDPVTPGGLTGLAVNGSGTVFGSTVLAGASELVTIDATNGTLLSTIGTITVAGLPISIGDLSFQPGTGILFGIRSNAGGGGGLLYTINTSTAVATLVGDTGAGAGGGIAFAPDGTLYQTAYNSGGDFFSLNTLNPADASRLGTVAINFYFDGLAVRADGTLFVVPGGSSDDALYTLDPITGQETFIGNTGVGSTSDLDFLASVPEPTSIAFAGITLVTAAGIAYRRRCRQQKDQARDCSKRRR
jgi:hypothetical protein